MEGVSQNCQLDTNVWTQQNNGVIWCACVVFESVRTIKRRYYLFGMNNIQIYRMSDLYGAQLKMPGLTRAEICQVLEPLLPYYAQRDREYITDCVCAVILERQRVS